MRRLNLLALMLTLISSLATLPRSDAAEQPTYRFAIVNPASPSRLHIVWGPFRQALSEKLDAEIELVFPKGIDQVEGMLDNNEIDLIYLNSYLYYLLKEKNKLTPLAQMINIEGKTTSVGRFIVRADSGIKDIDDLRGHKLALISPLGAGAYLAPRAYLNSLGLDIDKDIDLVFTGDLKKSVYSVLLGDAAATTMCGVNYRILEHKLDLKELVILDSTYPFPEPLIAAHTALGKDKIADLRQTILDLPYSQEGRSALVPLGDIKIQSFIEYDPALETMTENLLHLPKP